MLMVRSVPRASASGARLGPYGVEAAIPTAVCTRPSRTTSLSGANWATAMARSRSMTSARWPWVGRCGGCQVQIADAGGESEHRQDARVRPAAG